jgi:hypothetical protein
MQACVAYTLDKDFIAWRYDNPTGQQGDYLVRGPGIDDTNGSYYNLQYWKGTDFRDGDIIFRRNLTANSITTFLGDYSSEIKVAIFDSSVKEDYLTLVMGSWQSSGTENIVFNSVEIRYHSTGGWEDWIDLNVSYVVPESSVANIQKYSFEYYLRTDAFDMYEIKYNLTVPDSSDNRVYHATLEFNYNPVPEPITATLFLSGLLCLAFKKRR